MIDGRRLNSYELDYSYETTSKLDSQTSLTLTNYSPHKRVDNRSFLE